MGSLGVKLDYDIATLSSQNMLKEIKLVCCDYGIDNVMVAGSLRRYKQYEVGDIDLIIITEDGQIPQGFSDFLANELGFKILASGRQLIRSMTSQDVQFDFYACNELELPYMLLYLTGPSSHNIRLRSCARKLGYKLNQKSMIRLSDNAEVVVHSELDIYKLLGIDYLNPEDRY